MLSISEVILKNLQNNSEYSARVLPFIKKEYFERREEKILFSHISSFVEQYKATPTYEALYVALANDKTLNESEADGIDALVTNIKENAEESKMEWLIDSTEEFCKDRAMYNAIQEAVAIYEGQSKLPRGAIPDIVKDAVAVGFDTTLGHDYLADAEKRYEYYHKKENKVPFNLEWMNKSTKGGFAKKTLSIFMAGPHVGKSAFMCHQAAGNLKDGRNVLYFTMEMAEEEISKRIDANLLDLTIDDVIEIPKEVYLNKINQLKLKTTGKLIVKEYGMGAAHVGHFRTFINELRLKQNFIPDIIYVDYINICASLRMAGNKTVNSYGLMKSVSEELRGLASDTNTVIVSATQFNRSGFDNSDPGMDDISESFAVNFGVDYMAALIASDELKAKGQVLVKQLKNRFANMDLYPKFFLGFDRTKMKFYDIDDAQAGTSDNRPVMDNAPLGKRLAEEKPRDIKGFKF